MAYEQSTRREERLHAATCERFLKGAGRTNSEHGLGHLLNPTDPDSEDREWIAQVWSNIVRKSCGLTTAPLGFERLPAVGRISVSSPFVMKSLERLVVLPANLDVQGLRV